MDKFIVAAVQAAAAGFDAAASAARVEAWAAHAAASGARLVVFPEAFVGGYPKGLDFGARIGGRTATGRDWFRRYFEGAITVPGLETAAMAQAAAAHGLYMVVGVIERFGATLYCTALFFAPDGTLLGRHRKLMPTAAERLIWGFGDGSTLPVFETPLGRLGAVICWENYMPALRLAMYGQGITLYCTPTADDRETWLPTLRHIALEGRCFVISACQFARRSDYPADYPLDEPLAPDAVLMRGGSCIIGPLGQVLAAPSFDTETLVTAELDPADVTRGKYDFDVAGHYARPDVFRLGVDREAKSAVG
jgi:nitrilase